MICLGLTRVSGPDMPIAPTNSPDRPRIAQAHAAMPLRHSSCSSADSLQNAICIHEENAGLLWKHWAFLVQQCRVAAAEQCCECVSSAGSVARLSTQVRLEHRRDRKRCLVLKVQVPRRSSMCRSSVVPGYPSCQIARAATLAACVWSSCFASRVDAAASGAKRRAGLIAPRQRRSRGRCLAEASRGFAGQNGFRPAGAGAQELFHMIEA